MCCGFKITVFWDVTPAIVDSCQRSSEMLCVSTEVHGHTSECPDKLNSKSSCKTICAFFSGEMLLIRCSIFIGSAILNCDPGVAAESQIRSQASTCEICVGHSDSKTRFLSGYFCFPLSLSFRQCSLLIYSFIYSFIRHRCYIIPAVGSVG